MKIAILAGKTQSSNILYNAISRDFDVIKIIFEESIPRSTFLKRRLQRLGLLKVTSQLLFRALVQTLLRKTSSSRFKEIMKEFEMNDALPPTEKCAYVDSVNSSSCLEQIKDHKPDIVLINGTRIISKSLLNTIKVPFINIHAGITPKYRGVHGAYWALTQGDLDLCGVTVHIVDAGIDTGNILSQAVISPKRSDNFTTYPLLQLGKGIELLRHHLESGQFDAKAAPTTESQLWHHPTLGTYLYYRLFKKVK